MRAGKIIQVFDHKPATLVVSVAIKRAIVFLARSPSSNVEIIGETGTGKEKITPADGSSCSFL